jgi:hypothetical protein
LRDLFRRPIRHSNAASLRWAINVPVWPDGPVGGPSILGHNGRKRAKATAAI